MIRTSSLLRRNCIQRTMEMQTTSMQSSGSLLEASFGERNNAGEDWDENKTDRDGQRQE